MKGRSPSTRFVPVFAILAICVLGCQYFQLPEHLQSEAARRIEETQVKDELIKLPVSSDRKLIIVSEKASYGALMSILEHAKDRALKFRVVVRPNAFNDHSGVLDR